MHDKIWAKFAFLGNHCSIRWINIQKVEALGIVFCVGVHVLSPDTVFPYIYVF